MSRRWLWNVIWRPGRATPATVSDRHEQHPAQAGLPKKRILRLAVIGFWLTVAAFSGLWHEITPATTIIPLADFCVSLAAFGLTLAGSIGLLCGSRWGLWLFTSGAAVEGAAWLLGRKHGLGATELAFNVILVTLTLLILILGHLTDSLPPKRRAPVS